MDKEKKLYSSYKKILILMLIFFILLTNIFVFLNYTLNNRKLGEASKVLAENNLKFDENNKKIEELKNSINALRSDNVYDDDDLKNCVNDCLNDEQKYNDLKEENRDLLNEKDEAIKRYNDRKEYLEDRKEFLNKLYKAEDILSKED